MSEGENQLQLGTVILFPQLSSSHAPQQLYSLKNTAKMFALLSYK